jgi:hypothetical protein
MIDNRPLRRRTFTVFPGRTEPGLPPSGTADPDPVPAITPRAVVSDDKVTRSVSREHVQMTFGYLASLAKLDSEHAVAVGVDTVFSFHGWRVGSGLLVPRRVAAIRNAATARDARAQRQRECASREVDRTTGGGCTVDKFCRCLTLS